VRDEDLSPGTPRGTLEERYSCDPVAAMNSDLAAGEREHRARSQLFTVRLWKEEVASGWEYRGSVRDILSGAFHNFRDWSDLAAFMISRLEEDEPGRRDQREPTK
jgi:hypothetical protein